MSYSFCDNTTAFKDPEAAHESQLQVQWIKLSEKFRKLFRNSFIRVYSLLFLILLGIYILRGVIPHDLREKFAEKGKFELAELTATPAVYTNLQHYTPYKVIIQSKELVAKYNEATEISKVIHPQANTMTLKAVRFKKQLNLLKTEMRKTLEDQEFSCLPAIAVGIPFNLFMDRLGNLYINIEIVQVVKPMENTTVQVSNLFQKYKNNIEKVEEELILYDTVLIRFTDSNAFAQVNQTEMKSIDSYCLQTYLKSFVIEGAPHLDSVLKHTDTYEEKEL